MAQLKWTVLNPAKMLCERLRHDRQSLPHEIFRIDADTAAIVVDIDGIDYILTMQKVPEQRPRPVLQ